MCAGAARGRTTYLPVPRTPGAPLPAQQRPAGPGKTLPYTRLAQPGRGFQPHSQAGSVVLCAQVRSREAATTGRHRWPGPSMLDSARSRHCPQAQRSLPAARALLMRLPSFRAGSLVDWAAVRAQHREDTVRRAEGMRNSLPLSLHPSFPGQTGSAGHLGGQAS